MVHAYDGFDLFVIRRKRPVLKVRIRALRLLALRRGSRRREGNDDMFFDDIVIVK